MKKSDSEKLDALIHVVEKGFAAMERGFAAVADDISTLATKDDVAAVYTQVNAIERELRDIKLSLTRVVHREDMDEALSRIAAIEQHLGLSKRIAA